MAKVVHISSTQFIAFILFLASFVIISVAGENYGYARTIDRKLLGLKKEKLSHFRFYWQDIISGTNPSGVTVVRPSNTSRTAFGMLRVIDNPLTMGPGLKSKTVGKAQGFYASASQEEIGLLMVMNFAFMDGKYNGSTFTVLGRNSILSAVREMPVIGGSGLFRFARGYVQATTNKLDFNTGDATVEYNCYVMHY